MSSAPRARGARKNQQRVCSDLKTEKELTLQKIVQLVYDSMFSSLIVYIMLPTTVQVRFRTIICNFYWRGDAIQQTLVRSVRFAEYCFKVWHGSDVQCSWQQSTQCDVTASTFFLHIPERCGSITIPYPHPPLPRRHGRDHWYHALMVEEALIFARCTVAMSFLVVKNSVWKDVLIDAALNLTRDLIKRYRFINRIQLRILAIITNDVWDAHILSVVLHHRAKFAPPCTPWLCFQTTNIFCYAVPPPFKILHMMHRKERV